MWIAANFPHRVDRLVIASSSPYLGPASSWLDRAAMVRQSTPASLGATLLERWFTPGFPLQHPEVAELVRRMLAGASTEGYAGCAEAIATMDLRPSLGDIRARTLFIAGAYDPVTPPAMLLEASMEIKGAALTVIASAAHLANLEQPAHFTDALMGHLAGLAPIRGDRLRREVLGDSHVDRSRASQSNFEAGFIAMITSFAWGDIWSRPGLDKKTRSAITISVLAALGHQAELKLHLRGAIRNGWDEAELAEVFMHTAVYAGIPAANGAMAIARQVLEEDPATW